MWPAETRAAREPVGLVSLIVHTDGENVELSCRLRPSAWDRGYAAKAGRSALHVAHGERVIAATQEASTPSRRLLGRLGLTDLRRVSRFGCRQVICTT